MRYLLLVVLFASCGSGKFVYSFEMDHPVRSKELFYENDSLSIAMEMFPEYIGFTIFNKMNDGIKISWDEVSLSINGTTNRVVHKETGITKMADVQPPTTIPPKSTLKDGLVRTDMVYQSSSAMSRVVTMIKETFPKFYYNKKEKNKGLAMKGTKITVFLPYYVAGKYVSMYYDIYLRDVKTEK